MRKNHKGFRTYINNNYTNIIEKVDKHDIEFKSEKMKNQFLKKMGREYRLI